VSEYHGQITLLTSLALPDGSSYSFTYEPSSGHTGYVTGRIASVTLPTGGTISYQYSGGYNGINCSDGSTPTLTRITPDGTWAYSRSGSVTTITDPQTTPAHNQTVLTFQGLYEVQRKVYQGSSATGTLLKTVDTCYNGSASPCTGTAIYLPITQVSAVTSLPGTFTLKSQTTTLLYSSGLPYEVDEYAYGSGAVGSLLRKTILAYPIPALGNNIQNRPSSVTVQNASGVTVAKTSYTYGNATTPTSAPHHNSVSGDRGNPTTITYQTTGSTSLSRTFTYFDTGTVYTATDVNGAVTTYTYGACGNAFVTNVALPLTLSTSATWDPNCYGGVQYTATDANNQTATTYYTDNTNTIWRPTKVVDPTNASTTIGYTRFTDSTHPAYVESALNFATNSTVDNLTAVDGLGRVHVSQRKQSQTSSSYDSVETDYDFAGRPSKVTLPYQAGPGGTSTGAGTTTTYDALNRPTQVKQVDSGGNGIGWTNYTYTQNDVLIEVAPAPSGENTKKRQLEYDALGRITSVCEVTAAGPAGSCGQHTAVPGDHGFLTAYSYQYDASGNSTFTVSQGTQTRTYKYDQLGRMILEQNPETGQVTYNYDTSPNCTTYNGDLVSRTDAVGNVTCYAHDALHRVTAVTYPSGSYASRTPAKTFVYDSSANCGTVSNLKGRLAEAYTGSRATDLCFSYSGRGEVADVWQKSANSGGWYHVTAGYQPTGPSGLLNTLNLNLSGYPYWTYNPDGEGRTLSVSATAGLNQITLATNALYNYSGAPTSVTFGSGDVDSFTYDPNTGRMTGYSAALAAQPWVKLAVSGAQSGSTYSDADTFTLTVKGAANQPVYINQNGGGRVQLGTTDGNGDWSTGGPWGSQYDGTYNQVWYVGNTAAAPILNFNLVSGGPTPAGPTSSTLGPISSGVLTWNGNGSLAQLATMDGFNSGNAQTCNYQHDDLGRIAQVNCGTNRWGQTFSFDQFGNISWTGSTIFTPGPYNTSTNRFPNTLASYDANGNLLSDGLHNYIWDADGNLYQLDGATPMVYDALGRRVEQTKGVGGTNEILYAPAGGKLALMSGQTVTEAFIPLPAGATVVYMGASQGWYRHADWLGSSRVASTSIGVSYYDGAYSPMGETISETGTTDRNFTGQNADLTTGPYGDLYDFPAREYQSKRGRWISPDPAGLAAVDLANPQSWNRYAYVNGSPLSLVDPSGLIPKCMERDACVEAVLHIYGDDGTLCQMDGVGVPCGMVFGAVGMGAAVQCPNNACSYFNDKYGEWMFFKASTNGNGAYFPVEGPGWQFPTLPEALVAGAIWAAAATADNGIENCGMTYSAGGGGFSYTGSVEGHLARCQPLNAGSMVPPGGAADGGYHSHPDDPGYWHERFSGQPGDPPGDVQWAQFNNFPFGYPISLGTPEGRVIAYYPGLNCQVFIFGSPVGTGTTIPICP
jgi:RHS repeat-associated protein